MKTYLTILKCSLILIFFTACGGSQSTYIGETRMSENNLFTVTLEENLNDKNVTAEIELNNNNSDIPSEYSTAELYIGDKFIGAFNNGFISFRPEVFGDVQCEISFLNEEGMTIKVLSDTGQFYIETSFLQYNSSENGDIKQCGEGENIVLTPSNVTFGSSDMIWMYNVRIAKDKEITFDYESVKLDDNLPNFDGVKLDIHFRFDDYKNRYDLYPPTEPYVAKYIDAEPEKWVSPPVTLTHGVHNLYVCPSAGADKTYITVYHSGEKNGSFSANYKSIANWPKS